MGVLKFERFPTSRTYDTGDHVRDASGALAPAPRPTWSRPLVGSSGRLSGRLCENFSPIAPATRLLRTFWRRRSAQVRRCAGRPAAPLTQPHPKLRNNWLQQAHATSHGVGQKKSPLQGLCWLLAERLKGAGWLAGWLVTSTLPLPCIGQVGLTLVQVSSFSLVQVSSFSLVVHGQTVSHATSH